MDEKPEANTRYVVGYALEQKKIRNLLTSRLVDVCSARGIRFEKVDPAVPLGEQGPWSLVLHKLTSPSGELLRGLQDLARGPPGLPMEDPARIRALESRSHMLDCCAALRSSAAGVTVQAPRQAVVEGGASVSARGAELLAAGALRLPLVCKPLEAVGKPENHEMRVVTCPGHLAACRPPCVLQEFVNHGGVVYKVYVLGEATRIDLRPSMADVEGPARGGQAACTEGPGAPPGDAGTAPAPMVHRKPSKAASLAVGNAEGIRDLSGLEAVAEEVACQLRRALGLKMFNFDLIRSTEDETRYFVIDINYFPGYEKLPQFEELFAEFLGRQLSSTANNCDQG